MDRHSKETTLLIDLTFFSHVTAFVWMNGDEWMKMNKVILGWYDNEENELQKKRDNWVYIKNYNNDGKQVWVTFRCSIL